MSSCVMSFCINLVSVLIAYFNSNSILFNRFCSISLCSVCIYLILSNSMILYLLIRRLLLFPVRRGIIYLVRKKFLTFDVTKFGIAISVNVLHRITSKSEAHMDTWSETVSNIHLQCVNWYSRKLCVLYFSLTVSL